MSNSGWIGCDLDRTLAEYDDYTGPTVIGKPIGRMVARVQEHLANGQEVRIVTARVWYPEGDEKRKIEAAEAREAITKWCETHIGQPLKITCCKDYSMWLLYDDRAVQVEPNTGVLTVDRAYENGYTQGKADSYVARS